MTGETAAAPAATTLRWVGHTEVGRVRKNNEDSFLCLQFDARELHYLGKIGHVSLAQADCVFAVSDGMGGAAAGEFASRVAVEKITRLLPPAFKQSATGLSAGFSDVLTAVFEEIHRALMYLGTSYAECSGMGTTLSLCWLTPGWMYFGHIGDSRIYFLPAGGTGIRQLSHDDTYVGWLFRNGKINEREARTHPQRNALQRALGAGNQFVEPQVGSVAYSVGDRFLLCTDGLIDGLRDDQLLQLASAADGQTETAAFRMVRASVEASGRDNTTALLIEARP